MTTMLNAMPSTLPALRCPKCAAEMTTYERGGVVVDQCRECRGVYLDRGELERLIDAEGGVAARGTWDTVSPTPGTVPPMGYAAPVPVATPRGYRAEWPEHGDDDDLDERRGRRDGSSPHDAQRWDDDRGWHDDRPRASRKRSLIGELLEAFGD